MARLLGQETVNGVTEKYWLHTGDDGEDRITVEATEDVEPIFDAVKRKAQTPGSKDFHYKASIPGTVISEICKVNAARWGMRPNEVFRELVKSNTDRSKRVWKLLTEGRDFSKLQAKTYGT